MPKRDMNLIRQIGFQIEEADGDLDSDEMAVPGFTSDQIVYHIRQMMDRKLIEVIDTSTLGGDAYMIRRLTSDGHDFVEHARNDTLWKKATDYVTEKAAGMTIETMLAALKVKALALIGM